MNNNAHVLANFYLVLETEDDQESFESKLNLDTIIDSVIMFVDPNGVIHKAKLATLEDFTLIEFEDNDKKEKATKQTA